MGERSRWSANKVFTGRLAVLLLAGGDDHWSLQPIERPALPQLERSQWPRNPVDWFVLAQLKAAGLDPGPEADRPALIRRLTFDLTGLPPTPEEIDAFVADPDPDSYEHQVDRLLASPHFGERFGRMWLDVARFTESQGFEYDKLRERAWHYRDWVVASINADLPYDRFMMLQVAGDVLEPVAREGLVAAALLVCGPWDEAGNGQANETQKAITRQDELEDLIGTVCQAFLGMTVHCARCHDHKFDPIPQTDYYRMQSVFAGVRHGERALATAAEIDVREARLAEIARRQALLEGELAVLDARGRTRVLERRAPIGQPTVNAPVPRSRWRFEGDLSDEIGSLHGRLEGSARLERGRLLVDGSESHVITAPLKVDVREKTLEAWVALETLDQGGGAAISLETGDGQVFDAIVFGERQARKWIAGSNGFERTRDLDAAGEDRGPGELVQMAAVYRADGVIQLYRNGQLYGESWTPSSAPIDFRAGNAHLLFGMRHRGGANAFLRGEIEEASLYDRALTDDEVSQSFEASGFAMSETERVAALTPAEQIERSRLLTAIVEVRAERDGMPALELGYVGRREQPVPTALLMRGDVKSPGEVVTPGALSCVNVPFGDFPIAADAPEADRRRAFAFWLADPHNPLPARVIMNRLWQWHFGRGLVSTSSDLGRSASRPTHPELLDWLACELHERGWSLKSLHRTIVTSATYRQSSVCERRSLATDADNLLLWRFAPRRLEAEMVRDAILKVSGALDERIGGPSFRPFEALPFPANTYRPLDLDLPGFRRRSIYRMNVNSGKEPLLDVFDCPDPAIRTPVRGSTTTPLQALAMMNDPFVLREAERFANRVLDETDGGLPAAIDRAWRCALGRAPLETEAEEALVLAREHGLRLVTWTLFNATEFIDVR